MHWFGPRWNAPVCKSTEEVPVPVGAPCVYCGKPITAANQGLLLPFVGATIEELPYHRLCFLAAVGVNLTVHILYEGLPLCRFSTELPSQWPRDHLWTYASDYENANCAACLLVLPCPACEGHGFTMVNAHGPQEVRCGDCCGTGVRQKRVDPMRCPLCRGTRHVCDECGKPWVDCPHDSTHREPCPNRPPICTDLEPGEKE